MLLFHISKLFIVFFKKIIIGYVILFFYRQKLKIFVLSNALFYGHNVVIMAAKDTKHMPLLVLKAKVSPVRPASTPLNGATITN
jgi:hypothetical protein